MSVVIPAYNREAFLADALASVRAQTRAPAEVVVVDDGSTDGTARVAQESGAVVLRQPNRGVSAARNAGIRAATQPWIAFLDSDDVWAPDKLERQFAALAAFPTAAIAFCDFVLEEDGTPMGSGLAARGIAGFAADASRGEALLCEHRALVAAFLRENFMTPSTLVVRRELLLHAGLFDPALRFCEDFEVTLRLLRDARCAFVGAPLVRYRFHRGSACVDGAALRGGMADALALVAAAPERYVADAAAYAERELPALERRAGVAFARRGRFGDARRYLRRSFRRRPALATALAYGGAALLEPAGAPLYLALRGAWRAGRRATAFATRGARTERPERA